MGRAARLLWGCEEVPGLPNLHTTPGSGCSPTHQSAQCSHGPVVPGLPSAHMAPLVPICSALTVPRGPRLLSAHRPCGPQSAQGSHGPVVPICSVLTAPCGPHLLSAHSALCSLVCSALTASSGPYFVQRSKRLRGGKSAFRSHSWVQQMKPRVTSWASLAPGPTEASAQAPSRGGCQPLGSWRNWRGCLPIPHGLH